MQKGHGVGEEKERRLKGSASQAGGPGRGQRQSGEPGPAFGPPCVPGKGGYLSLYQSAVAIMGHVTNSPTILMPFNSFIVYFLLSSLWVCWGSADPVWE